MTVPTQPPDDTSTASFPAAVLDAGADLAQQRPELDRIRDLLKQGRAPEAARAVDRLMNQAAGVCQPEVLSLYARYLLARSRPFSAGRALRPLLRRKPVDPEVRVLYAEALADSGNVERAVALAEKLANAGGAGSVAAAKLFDDLHQLSEADEHAGVEVLRARLEELTGHESSQLFSPAALPVVDRLLRDWAESGQTAKTQSVDTWGYYLGEYCCQHLGARWSWRRRLEDATIRLPLTNAALELAPNIWARWCLEQTRHRFGDLVRVLLQLKGARVEQIDRILGPNSAEHEAVADPEEDPMSAALVEALHRHARGEVITGLGLAIDCPFGRVRVPLVVEESDGPVLVLRWCTRGPEGEFERYLDMLCLGPFGRIRWSVASVVDAHRVYERPDPGRRAALVARRLCSDDNAQNARWAVALAGTLLDTTLDGRLSTLSHVDNLIVEELRSGGIERWGVAFEDRFAMLFLLTCYVGEVVRRHYGGQWGADRITGEPTGPTAGLELGPLRFNLGATLLKMFYGGHGRSLLPAVREYARRTRQSEAFGIPGA